MQEAFDKLRGVDIFSLKSYMEPTGFASFNGAWVLINELFVNFFFFILNAVVGFPDIHRSIKDIVLVVGVEINLFENSNQQRKEAHHCV